MVYVYVADVSNLPDPKEFPKIMDGIPEGRKKKILRYLPLKARIQSLGAGLLLKYVLELYGASFDEIYYGEHGKPELEQICFNLSHSHDFAVCVVSGKSVGCDVEKIGNASWRIAERYFCKNELEHLKKCKEEEKDSEFYRLWTMKESYMKMTGEGLSLGLNRIEFIFEEQVRVLRDGSSCACFIKEYEFPGYKLTVCAEEDEFVEEVEWVKL